MDTVLVIDDDDQLRKSFCKLLKEEKYAVISAASGEAGIEIVKQNVLDLVILDLRLPGINGMETFKRIKKIDSKLPVIIITAYGTTQIAIEATKMGAYDYVLKPFDVPDMLNLIEQAIEAGYFMRSPVEVDAAPDKESGDVIIGQSKLMQDVYKSIGRVSQTDATVLILGESGTGKELVARAIYQHGIRSDKAFLIINCVAIPENLLESELFGYEKGAFTGAGSSMDGLIKLADGGTLSLDEVGELSLKIQKAFLRVLQERRYRPVGGKRELTSKFRLVSTTNRDLDQMVKSGQFRKDLLYRIRTISIELPPLRERLEDIKAIAVHHTIKICDKYEVETRGFSSDFFDILRAYHWPGNVRELINVLEETINNARQESTLFPKHLPSHIRIQVARALVKPRKQDPAIDSFPNNTPDMPAIPKYRIFRETVLSEMEQNYFQNLMKSTRGDIQSACELSGLSRSGLYAILKRYNISRMGWPTD
ncbi:MAG: sigma-54-dependent Fis family transcriptional regulator [Desulfobacula sp.]|nr:sigma-54-dependent Fis family transcriptional regulator [Desulfobacula sp.]